MLAERSPEAQDRQVPGHWEGDLIVGTGNRSAIGTVVDRCTRFVLLLHLPDGRHTADAVREALILAMKDLPPSLRRSLTWDQGKEMARHEQIAAALRMPVFFCDPHSPWQRGTNEDMNGLLSGTTPHRPEPRVCSGFGPGCKDDRVPDQRRDHLNLPSGLPRVEWKALRAGRG